MEEINNAKDESKKGGSKGLIIGIIAAIIITVVIAIIAIISAFLGKKEAHRVVKVNSVTGDVILERKSDGSSPELFEGFQLITDDQVTVKEDALLELLIDSDKHIAAKGNTCFVINAAGTEEQGSVKIDLLYGESLFTIDNKLPDGSTFEVTTPNVTLSVRGTKFNVIYDQDKKETTVEVFDGVVEIESNDQKYELVEGDKQVFGNEDISDEAKTENENEIEIAKAEYLLVKESYYDSYDDGEDETLSKAFIYKYYMDGDVLKAEKYEGDSEEKITRLDSIVVFDEYGYISDEEYVSGKTKAKYIYDDNHKLTTLITYGPQGEVLKTCEYTYNASGNLNQKIEIDSDGKEVYRYEYVYDASGNLNQIINLEPDGDEFVYEVTCDENGNDIGERLEVNYDTDNYVFEHIYGYDEYGNRIKETSNYLSQDFSFSNSVIYEYVHIDQLDINMADGITDLSQATVGDVVLFGSFEGTPVKWDVLDDQGDKLLIISHNVLTERSYNDEYEEVNWRDCDLRAYLNDELINELFSTSEQELIIESTITNPTAEEFINKYFSYDAYNAYYSFTEYKNICGDTVDKLFLLSWQELEKYYTITVVSAESENRPYAYDAVAFDLRGNLSGWSLRSNGSWGAGNLGVDGGYSDYDGRIYDDEVTYPSGVRPALWVSK